MRFLEKVIVALLSALILSLSLAFIEYTPKAEQQAEVGYFSFKGLILIYFMYSLPVFLIGGGLYSVFVDVFINKIKFSNAFLKYVTEFFMYIAGGFIIMVILVAISLQDGNNAGLEVYKIGIFGALASLLFFHISLAWRKVLGIFVKVTGARS